MRILIIIFIFFSHFLNGQGGFKVKQYPCQFNNGAKAIFETTPDNYITGTIGVDTVNNISTNRLTIMGLGNQGQVLWTKKYGTSKFEYLENTLITRSFFKHGVNLYYAGCVRDSNNKQIGVLIKFNLNGDTLWQKIYRDTIYDVIPQMVSTSVDGGFLITGFFQASDQPCLLIKTDINGNELWRKKINKAVPNVNDGKAIVQDSVSKKIVLVGYQYVGTATAYSEKDNVLILDSLGNILSQHNYTGTGLGGWSVDLIQTKDKKFVVVGRSIHSIQFASQNLCKSFIAKFDVNNPTTPIWKINNFGPLQVINFFNCIRELPNSDMLVAGVIDTVYTLYAPTQTLTRFTVIDKNGLVKSNRYYNHSTNTTVPYNDNTISLELTQDGGWVTSMQVANTAPNPSFFIKYDSTGCDSTEIYCQAISIGISEIKKKGKDIFTIYPNPANEVLNIEPAILNLRDALIIEVYNSLGQKIKEETQEQNNSYNRPFTISTQDLSNGVYLLNLKSDRSGNVSKRFIIAR